MSTLTEQERALLNCDCAKPYGWTDHVLSCFVPVVESILAARLADSRPAVTEAAVEAAAEAMIQYETNGCCHLRSICGLCDCFRTPENDAETQARELDRARHVLSAALPHMGDGRGELDANSPDGQVDAQLVLKADAPGIAANAWDDCWNGILDYLKSLNPVSESLAHNIRLVSKLRNPYRLSPTGDDSE